MPLFQIGEGCCIEMVNIPGNDNVRPFLMGKYVITQEQYELVIGENPSRFSGCNNPVECVSWFDCVDFCDRLREVTSLYFRLPSEEEWEHACRTGVEAAYCFGNDVNELKYHAWYRDTSDGTTHPVGKLLPNLWGLYDMHGNVWEWCLDRDTDGYKYLLRGGSWFSLPGNVRCANRGRSVPDNRLNNIGLRIVGGRMINSNKG
ncbi:MAG: formylglycine-generating enzyme family protein [bacterium]|nr:formylglycine-generating enzyme family protein [bacterium]